MATLNVPEQYKHKYWGFSNTQVVSELTKVISFEHRIHLKDKELGFQKQIKILDAH